MPHASLPVFLGLSRLLLGNAFRLFPPPPVHRPLSFRIEEGDDRGRSPCHPGAAAHCNGVVEAISSGIAAFNGRCVNCAVDRRPLPSSATLSPRNAPVRSRPHVAQCARPKRSKTDSAATTPDAGCARSCAPRSMPEFEQTGRLKAPARHSVCDQGSVRHIRHAHHEWRSCHVCKRSSPRDAEVVARLRKAGASFSPRPHYGRYYASG